MNGLLCREKHIDILRLEFLKKAVNLSKNCQTFIASEGKMSRPLSVSFIS